MPGSALRALAGGETVAIEGRRFEVAYTPGHAVHHVSYFDRSDGTAYVGDTAGIRVSPGYALPATPPPDIDLERWEESLRRIEAWPASRLYLTHFAEGEPPAAHLAMYRASLARCAERVRQSLAEGDDDEARIAAWEQWLRTEVRAHIPEAAATGGRVSGAVPPTVAGPRTLLAEARGRAGGVAPQLANAIARSANRVDSTVAAVCAGSIRKRKA